MADDSDDGLPEGMVIMSFDETMMKGLTMSGWDVVQLGKRKEKTNIEQYETLYGVPPNVTAQLIEDLQLTAIPEAKIEPCNMNVEKLHWTLNFLYRYGREKERESLWNKSANTIREATWYYVDKIRHLKKEKIVWPLDDEDDDGWTEDDIWVMGVDGTHLVTLEPGDSDIPKDPSYFSFKHHSAGYNYEVGVDLFESRCVWLSGPHKAGTYNDAKIFREMGLQRKLNRSGKKAIGDDGYLGFPNEVSTANSHDSQAVKEFKTRARQRHESFNSKLKAFQVLSDRFRCHNSPNESYSVAEKLQMCFEAVTVLVQYKMESGRSPLFDI